MSRFYDLAVEQMEGLRDKEWPDKPGEFATEREHDKHEQRVERHVRLGADVGIFLALLAIAESLNEIRDAIICRGLPGSTDDGHAHISVVAVELKPEEDPVPPIDHMPDFTLPSTTERAVLAVVGPKLAGFATIGSADFGKYATGGTWSTSDETTLPLEAIPDSVVLGDDGVTPVLDENGNQIPVYKVFANTPLTPDPGDKVSGVVTWKAKGIADVDIKVVYGDPALGHAAITASEAPEA